MTLSPLSDDEVPARTLTFSDNTKHIDIGRSSKREAKNLVPSAQNAWYNSRVMSRNHAVLTVSPTQKVRGNQVRLWCTCILTPPLQSFYIRDGASMHGTWVNDEAIPEDMDVKLFNGDVLRFGAEVSRGAGKCSCMPLFIARLKLTMNRYIPSRRGGLHVRV